MAFVATSLLSRWSPPNKISSPAIRKKNSLSLQKFTVYEKL